MDKYDKAVAYLTEHPELIRIAWPRPRTHEAGCLFSFVSVDSNDWSTDDGCLTMIKRGGYEAFTPELTAAIRADDRIPDGCSDITIESLPIFAEWQRRIDHYRETGELI